MKLFYQRHNECAMATACMLADQDYQTASDMVKLEFGRSWGSAYDLPTSIRDHILDVMVKFLHTYGIYPVTWCGETDDGVPEKGKATIVVRTADGTKAHAVAYEDGLIYDPRRTRPMTLRFYCIDIVREGWEITEVIKYDKG